VGERYFMEADKAGRSTIPAIREYRGGLDAVSQKWCWKIGRYVEGNGDGAACKYLLHDEPP
jgi:hypothetical protein